MRQKLKLIGIIVVLIALPLTVIVAQQVQNIVNRAAGPDGKLVMGINIYDGGYTPQDDVALQQIDAFAQQTGQYPGTFSIWVDFGPDGTRTSFPSQTLLDGLTSRNITPVIFLQPVGPEIHKSSNNPEGAKKYSNSSIVKGTWDTWLTTFAQAAKAYNKPVIIRYAHEMNGSWFPWSRYYPSGSNGAEYYDVNNGPQNYVKAWKHVYNLIKPIAPKAKFYWGVNDGNASGSTYAEYFPGDGFVDYVGFDSYKKPGNSNSLDDLYSTPIQRLKSLSSKPIIIGETAIDPNIAERSDLLTNGYNAVFNKYPEVQAIIYYNIGGYRLDNGVNIIPAYKALAAQTKFQGRFAPFTALPVPTPAPPPPAVNNPTGYHDGSDCSVSSGWTCDADDYNSPIDVHFYEGGTFLGAVTANQTRSDLPGAGVCGGTSNHGFAFATPDSLKDGNVHNITAYAINIGSGNTNPVLGNSPKTIQCVAPTPTFTPTPTPTSTPTPTPAFTPTPTPEPTATSTPVPTSSTLVSTPTFTPTPTPGDQVITATPEPKPLLIADGTRLSFVVGLNSIGTTGTNRVSTFNNSNKNPKHPKRPFTVEVFDSQNKKISDVKGSLNYVSDTKSVSFGKFTATVTLGKDFPGANYTVKIKTDGFLRKGVPGIQRLKTNEVNTIPQVSLIGGDINSDNRIDILDYNLLVSCSIFAKTEKARIACNSNSFYKIQADINDDGNVNELDYGYFLQEYSVQNGD